MTSELTTSFDDRHLSATSERSTQVGAVIEDAYDYMLVGSSWDKRCLSLTSARPRIGLAQLVLPRNVGKGHLRRDHDEKISVFVRTVAERLDVIEEHSEDVESVFARVENALGVLRKQLDRPLRMLVDLSAMTRYVSLGAVAMSLNDSLAEYVDVFYAEGMYGEVVGRSVVPVSEHRASWEAVAVPRLEGDWFPTHQRHFLVSVGFESSPIARLGERWDPDRMSVLFPSPSILPEYESHAAAKNAGWMARFDVGVDGTICASGSDAVAVWEAVSESALIDPVRDNVYCLLCGSKPHGLGLALYALARERPAVMYVRPVVHEEKEIAPNGVYWRFRLRDRTLIR